MKKTNRVISVIILVLMMFSITAMAADIKPFASTYFTTVNTSLQPSSPLALSYTVATNNVVSELGVKNVTLHDLTTGSSRTYSGSTITGKRKSGSISLDGAIKGHRYYATVTFCAYDANWNGPTTTRDTDTITY